MYFPISKSDLLEKSKLPVHFKKNWPYQQTEVWFVISTPQNLPVIPRKGVIKIEIEQIEGEWIDSILDAIQSICYEVDYIVFVHSAKDASPFPEKQRMLYAPNYHTNFNPHFREVLMCNYC